MKDTDPVANPAGPADTGRSAPPSSSAAPETPRRIPDLVSGCIVVGLFVIAGTLLWRSAGVILYGFAGLLLATFLDACALQLARLPKVSRRFALLLTLLVLVALSAGLVMLLGPRVAAQATELQEQLPQAYGRFEERLLSLPGARSLVTNVGGFEALTPDTQAVLTGTVDTFGQAFGALGNVAMVVIIGLFVALDPGVYREGALSLLPARREAVVAEILRESSSGLRRWLLGRLVAMLCVALLTGIGLAVIGLPLALTLALLAGLLSFIPFLGPALGVVMPLLIGLMQGPATAGWVLVIFAAVQFLEGNFITPLIERRALAIPPAVLIFSQVLMGTLAGIMGVLLASPILVVLRAVHRGFWPKSDAEAASSDA